MIGNYMICVTAPKGKHDLRKHDWRKQDLSHRDPHDLRKQRGFARKDSKPPQGTRLREMDEVDQARGSSLKRGRTPRELGETGDSVVDEQRVGALMLV